MRTRNRHFLAFAIYILVVSIYLVWLISSYTHLWDSFIYILGFILSFYWIGYYFFKDFVSSNIISIRLLFNVFGFLYSNNYVIDLITANMPINDYVGGPMFLSHLAVLSFNVVYSSTKTKNAIVKKPLDVNLFCFGLFILLLFCIAAEYYIIVKRIGLMNYILATRADRTLMRADYSLLSFYKHTIPMVSAISFYIYIRYKKKLSLPIFVISFSLAIFHSIISVSRTEFLASVLPVVYLLNRYKVISNVTIIALGIGGFVLMGIWKSLLQSETGTIVMQQNSEFNTWYEICKNILRRGDGTPFIYGESYFVLLLNLIIPVTGFETLSTWYLINYEPDVLAMGGGRGFSAVFEAYMNFNVIGVISIYGLYGFLAKKINTQKEIGLFVFMIIVVSIHQLFRSEAYSFWKNMMWFRMYPMLILYYFSTRKRRAVKK